MPSILPSSICGQLLGGFFCTAASLAALAFGILALIPANPFKEQDIALGVCLIIFSGVIGIIASLFGALLGAILCLPCGARMDGDSCIC